MKKFALSALALACIAVSAHARILPTSNTLNASGTPDAASWNGGGCSQAAGGSTITGCEVAIDFNGNFLPTMNSVQTLGTSALQFSNVYAVDVTSLYHTLTPQTTNQVQLLSAPLGSVAIVQERVGGTLVTNAYNLCVSTKAAVGSFVYVSVSTSVPAAAGAVCSN